MKSLDIREIVIGVLILLSTVFIAPPIIKTIYHIGIEVGGAVAKWF